jgi:hypothetical protein
LLGGEMQYVSSVKRKRKAVRLMRDRLIELIRETDKRSMYYDRAADYLLANGVIVPQVKIGDKLYVLSVSKRNIYEYSITHFEVHKDRIEIWGKSPYGNTPQCICSEATLGYNEWVYLTKEEAENALER